MSFLLQRPASGQRARLSHQTLLQNKVEELEGRVLSKQQIITFLNAEVDGLTRRNEQLAGEQETAISDLRTQLVAAEKHRQADPAAEQAQLEAAATSREVATAAAAEAESLRGQLEAARKLALHRETELQRSAAELASVQQLQEGLEEQLQGAEERCGELAKDVAVMKARLEAAAAHHEKREAALLEQAASREALLSDLSCQLADTGRQAGSSHEDSTSQPDEEPAQVEGSGVRVGDLERQLAEAAAVQEGLRLRCAELAAALEAASAVSLRLPEEGLEGLAAQNEELQKDVACFRARLDVAVQHHETREAELEAALAKAGEASTEVQQQLEHANNEAAALNAKLALAEADIRAGAQLKGLLSAAEAQAAATGSEASQLRELLSAAQSDAEALRFELRQVKDTNGEAEQLRGLLSAAQSDGEALRAEPERLEKAGSEAAQLKASLSEAQRETEQLRAGLQEAVDIRHRDRQAIAAAEAQLAAALEATAAAEAESVELRAVADALRRDNVKLRTEAAEAAAAQRGLEENNRVQLEEAYQQALQDAERLSQENASLAMLLHEAENRATAGQQAGSPESLVGAAPANGTEKGSALGSSNAHAEDPEPGGLEEPFASDPRWRDLQRAGVAAGWHVDPDEVVLGRVLGKGTFGTTYLGEWRGGEVAVKHVRIGNPDEAGSFLREVQCLSALRHPNILPFYGACLRPPEQCWLVCEFMPGGTLSAWLHGQSLSGGWAAPRRSLEEKVRMLLGIARGMQAMEDAKPPILHRDLKPSNVFIDAAGNPRVADMGLARVVHPEEAYTLTGETGTYLYMAPEMVRHELYDGRGDVYSFGVLLSEVVAQKQPYADMYFTPVQIALAVGDDSLRPTLPSGTHRGLIALAEACWEPDPEQRPTFSLVVPHLRKLLAEIVASQSANEGGLSRLWGKSQPVPQNSTTTFANPNASPRAAPVS